MQDGSTRVGVISDTHGLLRPEAEAALRDVDRIIHAGDVGDPEILRELERIAPVEAVRGNVDRGAWADSLPMDRMVSVVGADLYVLHDVAELDIDPGSAGFQAVIYGHSHRPSTRRRDGVLYLNPGSAGPRRFRLPVTLAMLEIVDGAITEDIIELLPT